MIVAVHEKKLTIDERIVPQTISIDRAAKAAGPKANDSDQRSTDIIDKN